MDWIKNIPEENIHMTWWWHRDSVDHIPVLCFITQWHDRSLPPMDRIVAQVMHTGPSPHESYEMKVKEMDGHWAKAVPPHFPS